MPDQLVTTKSLTGLKVVGEAKGRKIGKVRRFVFHPSKKRVVGFLVKRPDAALMFHRKDLFVSLDGYRIEDGVVVVIDDASATDRGAVKALGVDWESCVIWVGMPAMTASGQYLGYIDSVTFDRCTGAVHSVSVENGALDQAIAGKRVVPAQYVQGFKRGMGVALAPVGEASGEDAVEADQRGAIVVADEVLELPLEGGVAAAAGKATAIAANKAKKGAAKAKAAVDERAQQAAPTVRKAARKTGEAVDAGTFAMGKQLGKATGMFAAFKEEFDKASKGEGED